MDKHLIDIGDYIVNIDQIVLLHKQSGGGLSITTTARHNGGSRTVPVKKAEAAKVLAALKPFTLGRLSPVLDES